MIFKHYHLNYNPFEERISLFDIHMDARFKTALSTLVEFPKLGNVALVDGRTGVGKTTLLKKLREEFRPTYEVYYVHLGNLHSTGLFRAILTAIGERPRLGKDRMFDQIYTHVSKKKLPLCIFIDEVQLMDASSLTDLRLLIGSFEYGDRVKLILSGQPQMLRTLQMDSLTDLRERVVVHVHLKSLTLPETHAYIEHRIAFATGTNNNSSVMDPYVPLFDDNAIKIIFHHSEGIPRRINSVALKAMLNAYQAGKTRIDDVVVREACAADQS
jgi:general secretion pathway protein A